MSFAYFVDWAFLAIVSGCFVFGTKILFDLKENIGSLNQKIAIILERITHHEKEIEKHDERIRSLENGK